MGFSTNTVGDREGFPKTYFSVSSIFATTSSPPLTTLTTTTTTCICIVRSQDLIHLIRADEFYSSLSSPAKPVMPRPRKELDEYRGEIERRIRTSNRCRPNP